MKKRISSADIDEAINEILNSGSLNGREDLLPQCRLLYTQAKGMKYKKGIGAASRLIAGILMSIGKYEEAKPYLDESINVLKALKERDDLYFSVMLLQSQMETANGNFDAAVKNTTALLSGYKNKMSSERYASACLNMGTIYYTQGLLYNSIYSYQKVLSRPEEYRNAPVFVPLWMSYANTLKDLNLYDECLKQYLLILNETGLSQLNLVLMHMNLANIYAEGFNDYENSKKHMDECLKLAELNHCTSMYNNALGNWGVNLNIVGKYAEALKFLMDPRVIASFEGSLVDMVSLNINIAECLLRTGRITEAGKYLEQTDQDLNREGLTYQRVGHYDNYFLYHTLTKKYDEAIRYHNLYKQELDKSRRMTNSLQADQLNALIELERKEGELEVEKLQGQQAQREIEFTRQQNALMQTNIEQRNTLIDEFQKAIKRMELSDARRKDIFKELHDKINTVRRSSIETAEYDTKFNVSHQEHVQKLHGLYPTITPSEAKIAVMLSSGLSNKEIAAITLTTPRNIETQRLKLRKKLKLKTGQDLLERIRQVLVG